MMINTKRRLSVLASVFLTVFILLAPNVSAATPHSEYAGDSETVADDDDYPTATANAISDKIEYLAFDTYDITIYSNYSARDDSTNPSLGSNHSHTLNVTDSSDTKADEATFSLLRGGSQNGQLSVTFYNVGSDTTYEVGIYCKVADYDTDNMDADWESYTLTVNIWPW